MRAAATWAGAALALALAPAAPARAELVFAGEAERVYTIEPRPHLFSHELSLGAGISPLNSFYVGVAPQLSYTYHFSDLWAWEVVSGFYSFNINTGLGGFLQSTGQEAAAGADTRLRSIVSTNGVFRPLYGKLAVFNRGIVNAQTYLTFGVGMALSAVAGGRDDAAPAGNIGIGLMWWLSDAVATRLDVRDHYIVSRTQGGSVLMVTWAATFNFNVVKGPAWQPRHEVLP